MEVEFGFSPLWLIAATGSFVLTLAIVVLIVRAFLRRD